VWRSGDEKIHAPLPSITASTSSPTHRSNTSCAITPFSSKKAEYSLASRVRPFASSDFPPDVDWTYLMESEYDGVFVGLGSEDNLEDDAGSVREEIVIRSVII